MCDYERHRSDLYIRPCYVDACTALSQIEKGRALGGGLCLREACHRRLDSLGRFLLVHAGKVLFVWLLVVATFSVALKSSQLTTRLEGLWLPDSGRVEQEQSYTMTHLGEIESWNNLMLVQVEEGEDQNVLRQESLLTHLQTLRKASQVTVQLFDVVWRLKDICHHASVPFFKEYIDDIVEHILPCNIITPLDCFWEGSKLLGPKYPVHIPDIGDKVKWTNLNPRELLNEVKRFHPNFDFYLIEEYMNKSGIGSGYQDKPCLNPKEPDCPNTAPNKQSKQVPDIGSVMTGGCFGFAENFMHWPEQLIVGGALKNKTGQIKKAKAIQTVIQLMGERELYINLADTFRVHHIDWSQEKAALILDTWQKRFAQEVKRLQTTFSNSKTYTFSMATLNESLKQNTDINVVKLAIVVSLLLVFCMFMGQYIAVFGVMMLIFNTVAGLGFSSLLGISLNILTIQVVPYLCVGLSLRDVWTLLHHYKQNKDTKQTLRQCSPSILAHNLYLAVTFISCVLLPAPAVKAAALQCAILTVFNTIAVLIVFPTILSIDQRRKQAYNNIVINYMNRQESLNKNSEKRQPLTKTISEFCCEFNDGETKKIRLRPADILLNRIFQIFVLICLFGGVLYGIYHAYQLRFGLKMPEFLPRNCSDYKYLNIHEKYFGFYGFSTVTKEVDYPINQHTVKEYHGFISNMKNVLSSESTSWLEVFQQYLAQTQKEFEKDLSDNCINSEKWYDNASANAILAYKMLANTGDVNLPIEKSEILTKKLIKNGVIEKEPFYNYFSAWFSNDPVVLFLKNSFRPFPQHFSRGRDQFELKIPKTKPLKYIETQYYAEKLHTTEDIIELIEETRKLSDVFNEKGLSNYPKGLIFAFYDQFLDFFQNFALIFGINFLACFICTFFLLNFNTSLFLIAFQMILLILLAICYGLECIDMNILLIISTSVSMAIFGRHLIMLMEGFVTTIGNRERRLKLTVEQNLWPMVQADLALLIVISVFYMSGFDFIRKYYFLTMVSAIVVDIVSSFFIFPVFLCCFGPKPLLIPLEHEDRIATPSPQSSPVVVRKHSQHHHHRDRPRRHHSSAGNSDDNRIPAIAKQQTTREPSLTTITEESGCSITVQPEVVVETTTYKNQNDTTNNTNSQHVTTKVTATTNIKVEVHSRPNSRREERDTPKGPPKDADAAKQVSDNNTTD